jgi:hypothetical protein
MTVLYPNPATRRIVEQAISQGKVVLWIYDGLRSLFHNPSITIGSTVGAMPAPLTTVRLWLPTSSFAGAQTDSLPLLDQRACIKGMACRPKPKTTQRRSFSLHALYSFEDRSTKHRPPHVALPTLGSR